MVVVKSYRLLLVFILLVVTYRIPLSFAKQNLEDFDDFAEFDEEEFETAEVDPPTEDEWVGPPEDKSEDSVTEDDFEMDGKVEVEDNYEFEDFDQEEFVGAQLDSENLQTNREKTEEKLTFAKVPPSLRRNWGTYYFELALIIGMLIYFLSFLLGRSKNSTLAQAWYKANKERLEREFSIVGDDGTSKEPTSGVLMKESDHSYVMWCSGRIGVEGMLVQLRMVKRQDLINFLQRMVKPVSDQIVIRVTMEKDDMDNYVLCLAQKKSASRLHKDMNDLSLYIEGKKKAEDYGLPSSYQVLSEIGEASKAFISDQKVLSFIQWNEGVLEYMHITDQYSGEKPSEDDAKKVPETSKCLIFCFNVGKKGHVTSKDFAPSEEWMKLVLYCVEKARRFKLSREAKNKSDKNRQRILEGYNKLAHQQRTEQAQLRKEERLKAETEKYMNEEDPVKARKMEEKRQKKEQAKKLSKMKAVKIKSS
ncbi:PAT complex subunit CCDC47-like [Watersipora subatra]|uniref:PAT complex subunit CCDC47-like n=1 Tax=Watersipora subatra TaxID=2589382 RepID=UPI00355BCB4D